jgi:hypothetical protein
MPDYFVTQRIDKRILIKNAKDRADACEQAHEIDDDEWETLNWETIDIEQVSDPKETTSETE